MKSHSLLGKLTEQYHDCHTLHLSIYRLLPFNVSHDIVLLQKQSLIALHVHQNTCGLLKTSSAESFHR